MKPNLGSGRWKNIGTLAVLLIAMAWFPPVEAGKEPYLDGERLEFRLADLDGNWVESTDERFAGKVVLIDLWATWCPPCLTEIPTFVDLQERYRGQGLVIVGIAFEYEEQADARRLQLREFVEQRGINYLVLDGGSSEDFRTALPGIKNISGLPVEILVDRGGLVIDTRNGYGYKKRWARRLDREISGLLGVLP